MVGNWDSGGDFFNTLNYQSLEYEDTVHPNATGYMARLPFFL